MSGPRRLAIMRALVRPELWLGCDRTGLIGLATGCSALVGPAGFGAGNYSVAFLGIAVFAAGTAFLREIAKKDPFAKDVYLRSLRYAPFYVARPRWDLGAFKKRSRR